MNFKHILFFISTLLLSCNQKDPKNKNTPRKTVKSEKIKITSNPNNREFKVSASSELIGKKEGQYSPANAFDNNPNTAWVEGSDGNGIGEWIEITFQKKQLIKEMEILNGYQKSKKTYSENNRMHSFSLYVDGRKTLIHNYQHEIGKYGKFRLNQFAQKIRIQVDDIKKGTQYNDLSISDIKFHFEDNTFQNTIKQKGKFHENGKQIIFRTDKDSNRVYVLNREMIFRDLELLSNKTITFPLIDNHHFIDFHAEKLRSGINSLLPFYLVKIYVQYEHELNTYIHFVPKNHLTKEKIIFHESLASADSAFEYTEMEEIDINKDGYDDIYFKGGDCFNACEGFKNEVRAISKKKPDSTFTIEFK